MALYFSSAQRARRTVIIALVAALVAFGSGWAFGRQQVPTIESRVSSLQSQAADIAIGIERLDIEYEQTLTSSGTDTVKAGVLEPLDELQTRLQQAMDAAPWLGSPERSTLLDDIAAVRSSAQSGSTIDDFRAKVLSAGAAIRTAFGVTNG